MGNSRSKIESNILNQIDQSAITNIITRNATTISNITKSESDIYVHLGKNGYCGKFTIANTISANVKYLQNITSDTTADIKSTLTSDLATKVTQALSASFGAIPQTGSKDQETINNITNKVRQDIENTVTTENLNNIINQTITINKTGVIIDGTVPGDCTITNDTLLEVCANSIAKNVVNAMLDDKVLSRMTNDVAQTVTVKTEGIADILNAILGPLVAVIIIIILVIGGGAITAVKNPKGIAVIVIIIILICVGLSVGAYFFRKNNPIEYWGCEVGVDGRNTGKCIKFEEKDKDKGPFRHESDCNDAVKQNQACPRFWGCNRDPSGKIVAGCVEYSDAGKYTDKGDLVYSAPFYTLGDCNTQGDCHLYYECKTDDKGNNTGCALSDNHTDFTSIDDCNKKCQPAPPSPTPTYYECKKDDKGVFLGCSTASGKTDFISLDACNATCKAKANLGNYFSMY